MQGPALGETVNAFSPLAACPVPPTTSKQNTERSLEWMSSRRSDEYIQVGWEAWLRVSERHTVRMVTGEHDAIGRTIGTLQVMAPHTRRGEMHQSPPCWILEPGVSHCVSPAPDVGHTTGHSSSSTAVGLRQAVVYSRGWQSLYDALDGRVRAQQSSFL